MPEGTSPARQDGRKQMKVTPINKKFGKYAPGDEFDLPDRIAKVLVKVGKLQEVNANAPVYQTRMMTAEPERRFTVTTEEYIPGKVQFAEEAPYGYKADGTPRLRPGRPAKAE
jgi:hypothetical protein